MHLGSMEHTKRFLRAKLITQDRQQFGCLFLDQQHRVIAWEVLFQGSVDRCHVYTREVVKRALHYNSTAVIFAHQHLSGDPTPSPDDQRITRQLKEVLASVDIDVLDHIIVGARNAVSFAERGWL
jgi:DNA repair protein RadC